MDEKQNLEIIKELEKKSKNMLKELLTEKIKKDYMKKDIHNTNK